MIDKARDLLRRRTLRRYILTGITCYLLEMAILLVGGRLGWAPEVSVTASYWIGLAASFGMQKLYAFSNREGGAQAARQGASYLVLVAVNYLFTLAAVALVPDSVPVTVTRTICLVVTTAWNYLIYERWIFRPRSK